MNQLINDLVHDDLALVLLFSFLAVLVGYAIDGGFKPTYKIHILIKRDNKKRQ